MKAIAFVFYFIFTATSVSAQCVQYNSIELSNPSFEGVPGAHVTPEPWATCGITPDTQPDAWGVTQPASDGNTYVGFIYADASWAEGVSQELATPIVSGIQYGLSVDLSATNSGNGGINPASFTKLEIWGGDSICERDELLWSSPTIDHVGWQTYQALFTASTSFNFIYLVVNGGENAYLLVDNLRPIDEGGDVLYLDIPDSLESSCLFSLSGLVDESLIDSLVIEGDFMDSPQSLFVTDSLWSTELSFSTSGFTGVSVVAYSTDSTNSAIVCGQEGITIEILGPEANFDFNGVCSNTEFQFLEDAVPYDTNDIVEWNWDFGGIGNSMEQNPIFTFDTSGVFQAVLSVVSVDGCHSDTSIQVEVLAAPDANFTFTEVCEGYSTNFHDLSDEGADLLSSWTWDFADGNTSILEDPVHTYGDTGEYHVQLIVTDYNGCADTIIQGVEVFACTSINEPKREDYFSFRYAPSIGLRITAIGSEKLKSVRSYSVDGKLIIEERLHQTEYILNQKHFKSGVYVIEVISERNQSFKEFLVIP